MAKYRKALPQLKSEIFLTDGGLETTLIFHDGLELPEFAAFDLLRDEDGIKRIAAYFDHYAKIAKDHGTGFILEAPTWRASPDWGRKLGYSDDALAQINRDAIEILAAKRRELGEEIGKMVISGCIGPQGDGYDASQAPTLEGAKHYHAFQIRAFAETEADMITAITMTSADEAAGVTLAAQDAGLPVAISFTVETDGTLPSGEGLGEAIQRVDHKTDSYPAYYLINCAHPTHFTETLEAGGEWTARIRGLRANASTCSHEELDNAQELDEGDPQDLARRYASLRETFPQLTILGGCCGTDHRHIEAIALVCVS